MTAQFAKRRQDYELSRAGHRRFVFQSRGVLVGDVDGVETDLHRWIDVAARAVADHPPVGLHNFVFANESAIRFRVFFRNDFYKFKKSLQSRPLDFRGLFRGFALRKQNQPVSLGEIREGFRHAIQNFRGRPLQIDDAAMNQRERLAFGHLVRQLSVRLFQRAPKAAHSITVLPDILAFRFIQDVADVREGVAVRLDYADKTLDQLLEEYVVFPERVVRINQQGMAPHQEVFRWPAAIFSNIPPPTFFTSPKRVSYSLKS